jgi:tight adherence protein C
MGENMLLYAGMLAVFLGIIIALTVTLDYNSSRSGVARSLAAVEAITNAPREIKDGIDAPFGERVLNPAGAKLTEIGRRFTPADRAARLRRKMDLAGNPTGWDLDRVLAAKVVGAVVGGMFGLFIPLLMGNPTWAILFGIGLAVLGFFLPDLALYQTAYGRSERILNELPDALDLLTISVEAGLGFDAALAQVARNTEGPLADEFFRVLQEMQIGTGRLDALRALADRTDVADLRGFIGAMVQADSFGVPISTVLRIQSKEMRLKRTQRAEETAQKVPVKILFPLIFCILPSLFVVILGPAGITMMNNFSGS